MKRLLYLAILLSLLSHVNAGPVDRNAASAAAAAFLGQPSVKEVSVVFEHLYVFNGEKCYVILSADDRAWPVLGYSHEGCFDADDLPENIMDWLQLRDQEVQALVDASVEAPSSVKEAWAMLMNEGALPLACRDAVSPLIITTWGQRAPYNGNCPEGCPTGCAATVMAQIMKYWEYPKCGIGEFSYSHHVYGVQYANFGETTYDWDNMTLTANSSSPEMVRKAIATLMYHCGVSIQMDYGTSVSLAYSSDVPDAFASYFGYLTPSLEYEYDYSIEDWKSLLRNELNEGRPMFFAGQTAKEGHAFICDGYDEMGCFHFNWGWSGMYDGYFAIGALNPNNQMNYNGYNHAIIGIMPSAYAIEAPENLTANVGDGQVDLTWSATEGASAYNVYRDGVLVAASVPETSYSDTGLGYGTYSYYVKAISEEGDRSLKSDVVEAELTFQVPSPVAAETVVQDEALAISWEMPYELQTDLAYGMGTCLGGYGYGDGVTRKTFFGQRYPAVMLKNYASLTMQSVSVYFRSEASYTLYLGKGNMTGMTEVICQQDVTVNNVGWNDIVLETPLVLDYTNDLWVVICAPGTIGYPAAYCPYDGSELNDAARLSTDYSSMTASVAGASWLIKVNFEDSGFIYRIARNGEDLVSGLTEPDYIDEGLSSGDYTYQIWSELNGMECEEPFSFSVSLARVEVVSTNPEVGTVEGGGLVKVGSWMTVRAVPNMDDVFRCWMIDGVEVSTELEYSFEVTGDVRLEARYSGVGIEEYGILSQARQVEVFTSNGVKLRTLDTGDMSLERCLAGCAKGVYLLRITTEEGVFVKKFVK